ncbi:uncharacterized protein EURHEDRAFT_406071 [Aspergillus ruber CBS 135680]|uniref:Uncharacterized protein n=1 Tax=Aspergillus ruber (strain CBS 135680) TaxID=1388766 RepID=A0A017S461_ASPRC|nr:uncharacterized protein EURHEDRAFT_406071 [Aspergillus ruber CBS 135680]EYE91409.1 hypothetical protein EURHEDRAFT_406071 [Aspergillus ruber CBS 135680]
MRVSPVLTTMVLLTIGAVAIPLRSDHGILVSQLPWRKWVQDTRANNAIDIKSANAHHANQGYAGVLANRQADDGDDDIDADGHEGADHFPHRTKCQESDQGYFGDAGDFGIYRAKRALTGTDALTGSNRQIEDG